jgi:hypothetical protein
MRARFLNKCFTRLSNTTGATQLSQDEKVLLHLAKKLREPNRRTAEGSCFGSCLAFASAAEEKGIRVSLMRWTVLNDARFADHWALRFNRNFAIDLTSVQFDANGEVLQEIVSYPANYSSLREYPFEIFSGLYGGALEVRRFPVRTMWGFYGTMLTYDLRCAYLQGRLLRLPILFIGRMKEGLPLVAQGLREWAHRRLDTLAARINQQRAGDKTTVPGLL